jgi:dTMP kinase
LLTDRSSAPRREHAILRTRPKLVRAMPFQPFAGLLISLEGIDGSGKSTLQALLRAALQQRGWTVSCSREPTDGPEGAQLRAAARAHSRLPPERELALLLADRKRHLSQLVLPALARGEAVILDRYYHSTAAYQGAAGLDPATLIALNERFAPQPQLVVVLDLPIEAALARIGQRGGCSDAFERSDNLRRVQTIFSALRGAHFLHLDALQSPAEALSSILTELERRGLIDPSALQPRYASPAAGDPPFASAAARNAAPILAVLQAELQRGRLLEIGSGSGQHALQFANALPEVEWQCSDLAAALPALGERVASSGLPNLAPPVPLDVAVGPWPTGPFDAVYSANTLHIMRWPEVEQMFAGVAAVLRPGGKLLIYGPFHRNGEATSEGNRAFDQSLREEDPLRGIRDAAELDRLAAAHGLTLDADIPMPANNALRIWLRHSG